MAVLDSVCPLDCPDTCSLAVTVEDGRITKVDGSSRNPYTDGVICAKVRRYPERVYGPERILHPQRRVGPKGEGRFERIRWDEALAEIAARFERILAEDGGEAILPYHYGGSNGLLGEDAADLRFFRRLGASELLKTICAAPTGAVYEAMYGRMGGVPPSDFQLAKAIVLWGVNPSATSIHLATCVREAQKRGGFLAVIDPRRTPLARNADLHLPLRPGTDVVLALAMIRELVHRGGCDRTFLEQHTNGHAEILAAAEEYDLERAGEICGVSPRDIAALVEAYAAASPAVVRCGWGVERNRNGGNAVRAILAVPAVAGKFGVRGGGLTMSLSRPYPLNRDRLSRPELLRRPVRQINMNHLGRVLLEEKDPPVRALFVYNANPVASTPNQNLVLRGLAREDLFTVVHEQVMTDTALFADIVLPAQTIFEHEELHKAYGHYFLQHSRPVIAPVGESLSNPETFARLAAAMGFDEPELQATSAELLRDVLEGSGARLGNEGVERVQREGVVPLHFDGDEVIQFGNERPTTASGRVELCPPELGPVRYEARAASFPLTLLSPASNALVNSIFGERVRSPKIDLHPDDAAARGIADGDEVRVFNDLGEVRVRVRLTTDIRAGVVSLAKGLWRASTGNGSTSTALVADDLTDIGGGACFNDARVEVCRA